MADYILDVCVQDELWGIWCFIAQDNPDAATRVIDAAYEPSKHSLLIQALASVDDFAIPGSATSAPGASQDLKTTLFSTVASQAEFR